MKKSLKSIAVVMLLAFSVVVLNSCSDPDPVPTDVITDEDGIELDLKWTIPGKTESQVLVSADLDIRVYKDDVKKGDSYYDSGFDNLELDPTNFPDGTYVVKVYLFKTDAAVNFTLTADGISVTDPATFSSSFSVSPDESEIKAFTITKSGSKYTLTQ